MLDDVDLDVPPGAVFALLGRTAPARQRSCGSCPPLIEADAGEVRVAGYDLARDPDAVRGAIGVTGQFSAVDGPLTGEVVEYLGSLRAIGQARRARGRGRPGISPAPSKAYEWQPDDPRLVQLADVMGGYMARLEPATDPATTDEAQGDVDEPVVSLLDAQTIDASPAWQRLRALLEERGWSGWTRVTRADAGTT